MTEPEPNPMEHAKEIGETIGGALAETRNNAALIPSLHEKLDAVEQHLKALTERFDALNEKLDTGKRRKRRGRDKS